MPRKTLDQLIYQASWKKEHVFKEEPPKEIAVFKADYFSDEKNMNYFINFYNLMKATNKTKIKEVDPYKDELSKVKFRRKQINRIRKQIAKMAKAPKKKNLKSWQVEQLKINRLIADADKRARETIDDAVLEAQRIKKEQIRAADEKQKQRLEQINRQERESRDRVDQTIEKEWLEAENDMKAAIVSYGTKLASHILKREILAKDNKELIKDFTENLNLSHEDFKKNKDKIINGKD